MRMESVMPFSVICPFGPLMTMDSVQVDGKPAGAFLDPALSLDGRRVAFAAVVGRGFATGAVIWKWC